MNIINTKAIVLFTERTSASSPFAPPMMKVSSIYWKNTTADCYYTLLIASSYRDLSLIENPVNRN